MASSTNAGPHDSNIANKMDPRVNSNPTGHAHDNVKGHDEATGARTGYYSGSATTGWGASHAFGNDAGYGVGTTGGMPSLNVSRPHWSNVSNETGPSRGPNVGSRTAYYGTDGHNTGPSNTSGSGNEQEIAGPHSSDWANKLDPRVNSDRDGSRTYGGTA